MTTLDGVEASAQLHGLTVLGGFHPQEGDAVPDTCRTLLLLGPDDAKMWPVFHASDEFADAGPDPLDRWSKRVIGALADLHDGHSIFPSDRPYPPFIQWARKSGSIWPSPVGLLVHEKQGLLVAFRGALALPARLPLPVPAAQRPCDGCKDQPCRNSCPANALTVSGYDVAGCHRFLDTRHGASCLSNGCAVRLSCPVGRDMRPSEQLAFHMAAFHSGNA